MVGGGDEGVARAGEDVARGGEDMEGVDEEVALVHMEVSVVREDVAERHEDVEGVDMEVSSVDMEVSVVHEDVAALDEDVERVGGITGTLPWHIRRPPLPNLLLPRRGESRPALHGSQLITPARARIWRSPGASATTEASSAPSPAATSLSPGRNGQVAAGEGNLDRWRS